MTPARLQQRSRPLLRKHIESPNNGTGSREEFRDDPLLFDPGKPLIEALEFVGEPLMVDPHAMHDRRVHIVYVDRVFNNVVAEIVGRSIGDSTLDPAAGHPHAEVPRVVIATVVIARQATLAVNRSAELTAPYDERAIEHASLLEILDQCRDRLVGLLALVPDLAR